MQTRCVSSFDIIKLQSSQTPNRLRFVKAILYEGEYQVFARAGLITDFITLEA